MYILSFSGYLLESDKAPKRWVSGVLEGISRDAGLRISSQKWSVCPGHLGPSRHPRHAGSRPAAPHFGPILANRKAESFGLKETLPSLGNTGLPLTCWCVRGKTSEGMYPVLPRQMAMASEYNGNMNKLRRVFIRRPPCLQGEGAGGVSV